jgi:catechol 2,3-dioxygenase-like lactoylglutathione lyase family enzyme
MTKQTHAEQITHRWYTRPVFFVGDVERALGFYEDLLGFKKSWHEGDGKGKVCQVNRAECEIILSEDAGRKDKARLFVELTQDGIAELRREIVEHSIPSKESWWGYDVIQIDDPDGNELLFPLPDK